MAFSDTRAVPTNWPFSSCRRKISALGRACYIPRMDVVALLFLALWALCAIAVYPVVMAVFAILRDLLACR